MSARNGNPTREGFVIRGKHVLYGMFAMFGLVIGVNLVFVYYALDTFTGLTDANPYKDGLAYNQVLAARDAQRHLGWQAAVEAGPADAGKDRVTVIFSDAGGHPLTGLRLGGSLRRPTHGGMDQTLTWREGGAGRYSAEVALPARGNWDLLVSADDGGDPPFEMKTRLWFK